MNVPAAAAEPALAERKPALGALPEWDLSDLYPGRDSEALTRDLTTLAEEAEAFRDRYEGRLAALSGAELGAGAFIFHPECASAREHVEILVAGCMIVRRSWLIHAEDACARRFSIS